MPQQHVMLCALQLVAVCALQLSCSFMKDSPHWLAICCSSALH